MDVSGAAVPRMVKAAPGWRAHSDSWFSTDPETNEPQKTVTTRKTKCWSTTRASTAEREAMPARRASRASTAGTAYRMTLRKKDGRMHCTMERTTGNVIQPEKAGSLARRGSSSIVWR